jgi:uncharacterized protein (TIGR03437 family)
MSWAQPKITAVVDAATFLPGLPRGGALATVFCSGVSATPGTYVAPVGLPLPNALAGFYVGINGADAPILSVAVTASGGTKYAQINFQVPLERNVSDDPKYPGYLGSCGDRLTRLPYWPAASFYADAKRNAIAQHASDYSLVTPQNPAHPGETIVAYANDAYGVWPPPPLGYPTPAQPLFEAPFESTPNFPVPYPTSGGYLYLQDPPWSDFYGNLHGLNTLPLKILFAGMAPGMVGVQQVNFVVPASQKPGTWTLFFSGACPPGYNGPLGCPFIVAVPPWVNLPVGN